MIFAGLTMLFFVLLILVIPGFLLSLVILDKRDFIEIMAFSVGLSIAIDSLLALFLTIFRISGGITAVNIFAGLVLISSALLAVNLAKKTALWPQAKREQK